MSRIVLALSSDAPYAPHAAAMLRSALANTPQAHFVIHYLVDPDFPEATRALLRQSLADFGVRAALHFHTVPDDWVQGLPLFKFMRAGEMRPVMWYRLFLPRLLPQEPKALYLDCDTLVLRSLEPLWGLALGEHVIAAMSNPSPDRFNEFLARFALPSRDRYFNSGVMLMNLDRFRSERLDEAVLAHGRANADWTRFADQDSLVAVLHARRLPLAPQWNLMHMVAMFPGIARRVFSEADLTAAVRAPAIVHFEGVTKPWVNATVHPWGRFYNTYARPLPWPLKRTACGLRDVENLCVRRGWVQTRRRMQALRHWLGVVTLRARDLLGPLRTAQGQKTLLNLLCVATQKLPEVSFVHLGSERDKAALLQRVAGDARWQGLHAVLPSGMGLQALLDQHGVKRVDVLIVRAGSYDHSALRMLELLQMLDITCHRPKVLLYAHRHLPLPEQLLLREVLGRMFALHSLGGETLAIRTA